MQRLRLALAVPIVATSAQAAPASANDLGCQVLLCLSNPGGATQYPACVPPIVKLWERLALGGSFPGCSGGGVAKTKVYGRDFRFAAPGGDDVHRRAAAILFACEY